MIANRKIAITFGVFLITGILFGILNTVPALEYPDYLTQLASIKRQVLMAVFFQFTMATVYVCVAVLLYPIIKKYNERLALAYFGFRIIGAAFLFVGIVSLLLLLFVSQSFVVVGQPNPSHFQTIGELLRVGRDWMHHIGMILPWSIGGLVLYYCFFKMNLIPKWLSVWGILGSILTLIATFLFMFDVIKIITPIYFLMNTPTLLFELVLAVFLMIKGFNSVIQVCFHPTIR
jgi:hypothetical protein